MRPSLQKSRGHVRSEALDEPPDPGRVLEERGAQVERGGGSHRWLLWCAGRALGPRLAVDLQPN
jgi:hypothetical protein